MSEIDVKKLKYRPETKSYTIRDFYLSYIENLPSDPAYDRYRIDYKTYRAMVTDYFEWARDRIIEDGKSFKMPYMLGRLSVEKKKIKFNRKTSLPIDYKTTRETGKLTFNLNEHSNYYKYRFYWDKYACRTTFLKHYSLVMTRANKRRLAQIIINRERDYIGLWK